MAAAAVALFVLFAPVSGLAGTWYEDSVAGHRFRQFEAPRARPEPREPVLEQRVLIDTPSYFAEQPERVRDMDRYAFIELHKDGIFGFTPEGRVSLAPRTSLWNGHEGRVSIVPRSLTLRPNYALYGTYPTEFGRLAPSGFPSDRRIPGVSPRVLDFERTGR